MERSPPPRPDNVPVHCTVLLVAEPEIVHVGSPFFLKCGLAAGVAWAVMPNTTRTVTARSIRRMSPPSPFHGTAYGQILPGCPLRWAEPSFGKSGLSTRFPANSGLL